MNVVKISPSILSADFSKLGSEIINLEKGQILTKKNIFDSRLRVINEYKSRGFHNVQIIESTEDSNLDYASNLIFKITEGNKLRINKINIDGNMAFSDNKIKKLFKT